MKELASDHGGQIMEEKKTMLLILLR